MALSDDNDKTRSYIALTSGTMVSHYRIVEKIGAGGMGVELRINYVARALLIASLIPLFSKRGKWKWGT